jgi:hypothetical protein
MFNFLFGGFIGLIVGWNFLAQPAWAKTLVDKAVTWVKSLFSKKDDKS